jgi:uncharacterized membrane protein YfcA
MMIRSAQPLFAAKRCVKVKINANTSHLMPPMPLPTLYCKQYSTRKQQLQQVARQQQHRILLARSAFSQSSPPASTSSSSFLWKTLPTSFSIGTLAGVLGSLAGMGGGFVMIPLMTSRALLQLTQHQAHGTSLFAVMSTGLAGALSYGHDQVQWDSAIAVTLCGMISARFGANFTTRVSEATLKRALGMLMLAVAPLVPLKAYVLEQQQQHASTTTNEEDTSKQANIEQQAAAQQQPSTAPLPTITTTALTTTTGLASVLETPPALDRIVPSAMIGMVSGFLAGVFGVGGGVIVVPGLALALDCSHYQALATSLAAMSLPAAVGTYTHYRAGNVVLRVAPALALGAFAGAYLGGSVGLQTKESTLQWGFSGLLAVLGARTIFKA